MAYQFQGYTPLFKAPTTNTGELLANLGNTIAGTVASHRNESNANKAAGIKEEPGFFSSLFGNTPPPPSGPIYEKTLNYAANMPVQQEKPQGYGDRLAEAAGWGKQPDNKVMTLEHRIPSDNFGTNDPGMASYYARTRSRESGGNDYAKNPNSSATGRYQFTSGTWADVARKNPHLGLTPDGRTDPVQQEKAMQAFTTENKGILENNGIQATPGNLYAAHFFGPGGAVNFIKAAFANPNAPAAAIVGPQVAQANQTIFYNKDGSPKTAGQVYSGLTSKFNNQADMPIQGGVPAQGAQPGLPPAYSPAQGASEEQRRAAVAVVSSSFATPQQQALAMQVLGGGKPPSYDFQMYGNQLFRKGSDGSLMPVDGVTKPPEGYRPMSPQEREAYAIPNGVGAAIGPNGEPKVLGKGGVNVEVGGPQGKYGETLDEADAKNFIKIREGAQAAMNSSATIGHMRNLLQMPGVFQGAGGQMVAQAKGLFDSLGIKTEGLSESQAVQALGNKIALELRNPAGGAGMPGAMSDSDRNFLTSMVPGLSNTKDGNLLMLDYMERVNQRSLQIHKMASEYANRNRGRLDNGFYTQMAEWSAQTPLFNDGDYERIRGMSSSAQPYAGTPPQGTVYPPAQQAPPQQPPQQQQPVRVMSPQDARRYPSGTPIQMPDGTIGRVP